MQIQEVIDHVFEIAPNPPGMDENNFLSQGSNKTCKGIGVAWWLTSDILADMHEKGINLGLCHEPVFFDGLKFKPFSWGPTPTEKDFLPNVKLRKILEQTDITVHRFHSNIDKADFGMPRALLKKLQWDKYPIEFAGDVPCVTIPEQSLEALATELKDKLGLPFIKFDGVPERKVSRAVVLWGGLCQFWGGPMCASLLNPDVIIGGDVIDGVVRICHENGWSIIDALHYITELDGMQALAEKLEQKFNNIPIKFYSNTIPFPNII